jgi:hypothetical protein
VYPVDGGGGAAGAGEGKGGGAAGAAEASEGKGAGAGAERFRVKVTRVVDDDVKTIVIDVQPTWTVSKFVDEVAKGLVAAIKPKQADWSSFLAQADENRYLRDQIRLVFGKNDLVYKDKDVSRKILHEIVDKSGRCMWTQGVKTVKLSLQNKVRFTVVGQRTKRYEAPPSKSRNMFISDLAVQMSGDPENEARLNDVVSIMLASALAELGIEKVQFLMGGATLTQEHLRGKTLGNVLRNPELNVVFQTKRRDLDTAFPQSTDSEVDDA